MNGEEAGREAGREGATPGQDMPVAAVQTGGCCGRESNWFGTVSGLFLLAFAMFVFGCGLSQFGNYIDVPSLVIVGGAMVGGWLIAHGWRGSWRAVKVLVVNQAANPGEARLAKDFCANGIWLAVLSGALGTIIGAINILANGFDLNMEKSQLLTLITSAAAVCILTFFWSWIAAMVLVPFYYRAKALLRRQSAGE